MHSFRKGQRIRVVGHHPWMANRYGIIKDVEPGSSRFLVKFERGELRTWHDEDGDPVLLLGDKDLILAEESGMAA